MSTNTNNLIPCLITTDKDKRGVFMGYINPDDMDKEVVEAHDVRMCVYWNSEVKGVLGLAATGPSNQCKVSKAAKRAKLHGVTAVFELTSDAEAAWAKEPWA